jgi:hypothetical protein
MFHDVPRVGGHLPQEVFLYFISILDGGGGVFSRSTEFLFNGIFVLLFIFQKWRLSNIHTKFIHCTSEILKFQNSLLNFLFVFLETISYLLFCPSVRLISANELEKLMNRDMLFVGKTLLLHGFYLLDYLAEFVFHHDGNDFVYSFVNCVEANLFCDLLQ